MPNPSGALGSLRPDLGSFYEFDLQAAQSGFIGYRVLPILETAVSAGSFGVIPSEQLGKLKDVTRGSSGGYNRANFTFDDDSFVTKEYGLEGVVDRRNARLYENYFNAEVATTRMVVYNVLAKAEKRVADAVFNTTTWTGAALTTALGGGSEWSVITTTPIVDVFAASQKVRDNCGQYADTLIISRYVFRKLQLNTSIIARIESAGAGAPTKTSDITAQMLAMCFDLDQVIVADSTYDSANEGQVTVFSDIWSNDMAMVCRLAKTNSIEEVCIGRTFHWGGDGSIPGGTVESYEENQVRGDVIRVRHEVHEKIIYPQAGHLITNTSA